MSIAAAVFRAEGGTADPIRTVSVVSTRRVPIHPEHALGTRKPLYWWLLTSRRWLAPRPINVYVIEHAQGLLLFDTGQDRASVTDDAYSPAGLTAVIYHGLARFHVGAADILDAQLRTLGYSVTDVDSASSRTCIRITSAEYGS
jgi:N-acyl homoserine lactone hydrolase